MKKLFLLVCCVVSLAPRVFAQTASNCTPSAALINAYKNDVADMALQRLYDTKSPDTARIEIPQIHQDSIMQAMAGVCNLGTQYEADSVFMNYCVHRYPYQGFMAPAIQVKVDTAYAWAKQWSHLANTSGYTALDQFLSLHDVRLTSYFCAANSEYLNNYAYLSPSRVINLKAFADSLRYFTGVLYYYNSHHTGDGDRINYSLDSTAHLQFIAGRGDCPSGCTTAKIWNYTVAANCAVSNDSIVIYGLPYQTPYGNYPNCSLRPLSIASQPVPAVTLYPNPVAGDLQLSAGGNFSYKIVDAVGALQQAGRVDGKTISVAKLRTGLYILMLTDEVGNPRQLLKFMRQ